MVEMNRAIKRRTSRGVRANMRSEDHHNVYVVLLDAITSRSFFQHCHESDVVNMRWQRVLAAAWAYCE